MRPAAALLILCTFSEARAQSLGEAARREQKRREALKGINRPPATPTPTPVASPAPPSLPAAASAGAMPGLSVIYTGRSLGALGALRSQDEHELLTERANQLKIPFKLVSHACWRAPGVSVFLPSDEPEGDELPRLLGLRASAEKLGDAATLFSGNALLLQDPDRAPNARDLLAMLRENPRAAADFPDLQPGRATVYRASLTRKKIAYFVEEEGASFSPDPASWEQGEMNRVDIDGTRIFELPLNLAQIGPRATLVRRFISEARARGSLPLAVDLGSQNGDLGLTDIERARIDFGALRRLGYEIVVPYEFELGLGARPLLDLRNQVGGIGFLASNLKTKAEGLIEASRVVSANGARFGLVGLVDPGVKGSLPKHALGDWTFEDPVNAAAREVQKLRLQGVEAVIVLSNLPPQMNSEVGRRVAGIDAIVADLHVRWSPENMRVRVDLPDRPYSRPGSPALVARGFANGLGVGRLEAELAKDNRPGVHLAALVHELASVTDRVPDDRVLSSEIRALREGRREDRGEMLVPSFVELEGALPRLRSYDATTAQGRISKGMWEEFMARLLRRRGFAEVAVIRSLSHFPPLIGKLHEDEVRQWLWTNESIVTLDLRGDDLREILNEDTGGELVLSGFDRGAGRINGRPLNPGALYRVATTDLLFEGARFRAFEHGRRVRKTFHLGPLGLRATDSGGAIPLRELVLDELRRIRASNKGEAQILQVAALLAPDPPFEKLSTFYFDRPTLFGSATQGFQNEAYGAVPESRATAQRSGLFGASGRFRLIQDRQKFTTEYGATLAYSRQITTSIAGRHTSQELTDDLAVDVTLRPKIGNSAFHLGPFARAKFDTEFTPTVNPQTAVSNPRQAALSGVIGLMRSPSPTWRALELGGVVETDVSRHTLLAGVWARAEFQAGRGGRLNYRLRNDLTWFAYTGDADESVLRLRYNMIHEVLFPLFDELSLSVAADALLFQGATPSTHKPGLSLMLRVGLTYDRLWKPRYQPLF
jgi:2',3'-cyclic-nucleotide 2'-phosphodiesterase (5'-nucleotidase family)